MSNKEKNKSKSTQELINELRKFHHYEAAKRLEEAYQIKKTKSDYDEFGYPV